MKPSEAAIEVAARAYYEAESQDTAWLYGANLGPAWEDVDEKYKPAWRNQVEFIVAAAAPVIAAATLRAAADACRDASVRAWLELRAEDIEAES